VTLYKLISTTALCWPLANAGLASDGSPSGPSTSGRGPVLVCGPQCVQTVLSHYGFEVDLRELVNELQWPDLSKGSSLFDMAVALSKRGVYCQPVSIEDDVPIKWPHPVIVHFEQRNTHHFAVLTPDGNDSGSLLWSPVAGFTRIPNGVCLDGRTAIVLLTCSRPIQRSNIERLADHLPRYDLVFAATPFLVIAICLTYSRLKPRQPLNIS